jgi:hypothetical protein
MIHVRQQLAVHLFHLRPIGAVHVRHVEIIALVAPTLVEDLFELFFRIEVHAQRHAEPPLALLRRLTIGVHQEKRGAGCGAGARAATTPPAAESAAGAIDQLVAVRAHVIIGDSGHELRGATVAQTIALQRAPTASSEAASATFASSGGFEVIDRARHARAQLRILAFGHARHGDDALLQSLEIYLNCDRRARRAWRLRRPLSLSGVGVRRSAPAPTTEAPGAARRRAPHPLVLIALRQERTRFAFLKDREI